MKRAVLLASAAVVLTLAAAAIANVALNPAGTDGVVFGKLYLRPTPGKAGLKLELLTTDPPAAESSDFYCVDDVARHECCFKTSSGPYCWGATPQPTMTPAVRPQLVRHTSTPTATRTPSITPAVPPLYVDDTP